MNKKTIIIKQHFDSEARDFDAIVLKTIPFYKEMVNALFLALPFTSSSAIRVLDLGCGTGSVSKKVKERYKKAKITCLDIAPKMLHAAKHKLRDISDISYEVADFQNYEFTRKYDVILSSLALHHLTSDLEKQKMFQKIFKALNPKGVFYNADVVLGSNHALQQTYMVQWVRAMAHYLSKEKIKNEILTRYQREDTPAKLLDQLKWLEIAGFRQVDVIWKYYNFAVYGGVKS